MQRMPDSDYFRWISGRDDLALKRTLALQARRDREALSKLPLEVDYAALEGGSSRMVSAFDREPPQKEETHIVESRRKVSWR